MKRFIFIIFISLIFISILLIRNLFSNKQNDTQIKEEIIIQETTKDNDNYEDIENGFKMLDFDRRLILKIGQQDNYLCSIFNLAYARAILDNDYNVDPYDYYDGEGAVWHLADYEDIAYNDPLLTVLQRAYDEINNGRPTLFYVSGNYGKTVTSETADRNSGEHFILIIGYKLSADYDNLKPSDFYTADPSGGYCYMNNEGCLPWVILTDDAPLKIANEYALYASSNKKKGVATCIAYIDTSTWNADLSKPIYPNYVSNDR